jgi:hypothetical protein
MIIDRSDCDIGLPSLSLEDFDPSPLLHMKLQSQLIGKLARTFGLPKYVVSVEDVQKYQQMIEVWIASFPRWYDCKNPDTSRDEQQPWMKLHRHYLHTLSNSMVLDPIRPFLAKDMSRETPEAELQIRRDGIRCCLKLMDALYAFFAHVYPRDSKFHFVVFCIFDTASVMCSTIIHDLDDSAPKKAELLEAVDGALSRLKQLTEVTVSAKTSYQVLGRIATRARAAAGRVEEAGPAKRKKSVGYFTSKAEIGTVVPNHEEGHVLPMPPHAAVTTALSGLEHTSTSTIACPNVPAPSPMPQNGFHNGFQMGMPPQQVDYSIPPQFPMQNYMPQATFPPHTQVSYAMDPMRGMHQPPVTHGHHMPMGYTVNDDSPFGGALQSGSGLGHFDLSAITEEEIGQLAAIWPYRSMNQDFNNSQP